jgi:hypothetical protein
MRYSLRLDFPHNNLRVLLRFALYMVKMVCYKSRLSRMQSGEQKPCCEKNRVEKLKLHLRLSGSETELHHHEKADEILVGEVGSP